MYNERRRIQYVIANPVMSIESQVGRAVKTCRRLSISLIRHSNQEPFRRGQ